MKKKSEANHGGELVMQHHTLTPKYHCRLDGIVKQYKDKEKYYREQLKKLKFETSPPPPTEQQLEEMVKVDLTTEVAVEEERLSVMKPNLAAIEEYRKKEEVYKKK